MQGFHFRFIPNCIYDLVVNYLLRMKTGMRLEGESIRDPKKNLCTYQSDKLEKVADDFICFIAGCSDL